MMFCDSSILFEINLGHSLVELSVSKLSADTDALGVLSRLGEDLT